MQLKKIIGSLAILGFVSATAIAAPAPTDKTTANEGAAVSKAQQAYMDQIVNHNQDNASHTPSSLLNQWYKHTTISGEFDTDAQFAGRGISYAPGNRQSNFTKGPTSSVSLATAELYLDTDIGSWTHVHAALDYDNDWNLPATSNTNNQTLFFSEATVQVSNFAKSPLWIRAGRQFLNFGDYEHDTITKPLTQLLTEANTTAFTAGYMSSFGLNADVYGFTGLDDANTDNNPRIRGFGADLGFAGKTQLLGYDIHVGFLNNMADLERAKFVMGQYTHTAGEYHKQIPGISAHVGLYSGPFDMYMNFVSATEAFSPQDLVAARSDKGAKPWAYGIEFGYNFDVSHMTSEAMMSYQQSGDAQNFLADALGGFWMPEYRMLFAYRLDVLKNVYVKAEYDHDIDYSSDNGGSGKSDNIGTFRLGVKF
tara:strand:- start:45235 stop:46503 length:1269 start_codon:yes stop_codon:yes gene_type:complete